MSEMVNNRAGEDHQGLLVYKVSEKNVLANLLILGVRQPSLNQPIIRSFKIPHNQPFHSTLKRVRNGSQIILRDAFKDSKILQLSTKNHHGLFG